MFLALQFADDELHSALTDVVPEVSPLLEARPARLSERVPFRQLEIVAGPIKGDHFI